MRGFRASLILALALSACAPAASPAPSAAQLSGSFVASGGGGGVVPMKALAARFTQLHPRVTWQVNETNSDAGVKLAASGQIDLGFITRPLTADEAKTVQAIPMGVSGTAVIVNAANPVKGLTKAQLQQLYNGTISDWSEIGGPSAPVKLFMREPGAATRSNFESFVFGGKPGYSAKLNEIFETDGMLTAVASFAGAIGIATVDAKTHNTTTVRMLAIEGVTPSPETLGDGTYKMARPLFLVYRTDSAALPSAVRAFLDFVRSPEGQSIIADAL